MDDLYTENFDFEVDDGDVTPMYGKRTFSDFKDVQKNVPFKKKSFFKMDKNENDDGNATTTILNLRASLEEKDQMIAKLKSQLNDSNNLIEEWKAMAKNLKLLSKDEIPTSENVRISISNLKSSESKLKDQIVESKRKENCLLIKIGNDEHEISELKSHIRNLQEMLLPNNIQTNRVLLDPVIHAEFTHLKNQFESSDKKVKDLQDELSSIQFTPHSKHGKMLMAKCRTLQEENEEIGREMSEGKMHELENKLLLQKQINAELKKGYQELQEYVDEMNEEAEKQQLSVYNLQRQLQLKEIEIVQFKQSKKMSGSDLKKNASDGFIPQKDFLTEPQKLKSVDASADQTKGLETCVKLDEACTEAVNEPQPSERFGKLDGNDSPIAAGDGGFPDLESSAPVP